MRRHIILFGATGDLTSQKLLPTLYHLQEHGRLAEDVFIWAIGRRDLDTTGYLEQFAESVTKIPGYDAEVWQKVKERTTYFRMDLDSLEDYVRLYDELCKHDGNELSSRLFYLAIPPEKYRSTLGFLTDAKLHIAEVGEWSRIMVEKPFGDDLKSARILNQAVQEGFVENQVYRVDHYLAKETVQNILAFRFANGMFEPLWNSDHIDHIQITVAEDEGIGNRAPYYNPTGAFKDLVQNHILQLVALLTMEEPIAFSLDALSDEKLKILRQLSADPEKSVFGQYEGYLEESQVPPHSMTETYAMTTFTIDNNRWAGVPIYVRTGKALEKRISEISVVFKETKQHLFDHRFPEQRMNVLTFRIQPDEGIALQLAVKVPREKMMVQAVQMEFCYHMSFRTKLPDAYERVFLDGLEGDSSLALRGDVLEESWRITDQLLDQREDIHFSLYPKTSWGPTAADDILTREERRWLAHESMVCNGVTLLQD